MLPSTDQQYKHARFKPNIEETPNISNSNKVSLVKKWEAPEYIILADNDSNSTSGLKSGHNSQLRVVRFAWNSKFWSSFFIHQ